jgi:hypothetical protein
MKVAIDTVFVHKVDGVATIHPALNVWDNEWVPQLLGQEHLQV